MALQIKISKHVFFILDDGHYSLEDELEDEIHEELDKAIEAAVVRFREVEGVRSVTVL